MSEWQPIETAPKDGTEVWAYRADSGVFVAMFGAMDIFPMSDAEIEAMDEGSFWQEDWWAYAFDGVFRLEDDLAPTHWHPLPDPPVAA